MQTHIMIMLPETSGVLSLEEMKDFAAQFKCDVKCSPNNESKFELVSRMLFGTTEVGIANQTLNCVRAFCYFENNLEKGIFLS